MRNLIDRYEMLDTSYVAFAGMGKPMFGTCAGLILLANKIVGYDFAHIGVIDMQLLSVIHLVVK